MTFQSFALAVGGEDECAFAGADENSYLAHACFSFSELWILAGSLQRAVCAPGLCTSADVGGAELGEQRSGVALLPAAAGFGEDVLAVFRHLRHDGAGRSGLLVPRAPEEQFEEHGGEVDALFGEAVVDLARVGRLLARR